MNHRRAVSCDTPAARPASFTPSPARIPAQNASRTGRGTGLRPLIATLPFQECRNDPLNRSKLQSHDHERGWWRQGPLRAGMRRWWGLRGGGRECGAVAGVLRAVWRLL
jgi:hypothetical protein